MSANVAMLVMGVVFTGIGIAALVWTVPIQRAMVRMSDAIPPAPRSVRNAVYTPRNFRWGGAGSTFFGLLCAGILVWRVLHGYSWSA